MNKKLLLVLISSILTFGLLVFFVVVSWEVFVGEEVSLPVAKDTEKTCSELGGSICLSSETCSGSWFDASNRCCDGGCEKNIKINTTAGSIFAMAIQGDLNNYQQSLQESANLGVKWGRLSGPTGIIWDLIESTPGKYNWDLVDPVITDTYNSGINIFMTVLVVNKNYNVDYGYKPAKMDPYLRFLKAAVERYDGDGVNDAPGSPVVSVWQIGNEVDNKIWKDTYENYAILLEESAIAIREANPNAKVAIAGMMGPTPVTKDCFVNYQKIVDNLNKNNFFDILDLHWHALEGGNYQEQNEHWLTFDEYLEEAKNLISGTDTEIWITEISISDSVLSGQTEKLQTIDLIKRYVYPVANGVGPVFWGLLYDDEWNNNPDHYFSNIGLINLEGNKKLSYYTYKLMVEKLEGSDWDNIQTIQESDNVYVYKFMKKDSGEPVWVLWWDYFDDTGTSKTISLDVGSIGSVKITEAVPKYEAGKEVTNYNTAFKTETKTVSDGKVTIILGESPVFVEEK